MKFIFIVLMTITAFASIQAQGQSCNFFANSREFGFSLGADEGKSCDFKIELVDATSGKTLSHVQTSYIKDSGGQTGRFRFDIVDEKVILETDNSGPFERSLRYSHDANGIRYDLGCMIPDPHNKVSELKNCVGTVTGAEIKNGATVRLCVPAQLVPIGSPINCM